MYSTASLATFMWPLRSMGIRSLFSLTKSQVDWGLDLKPSERYTQGQSFSSNIDEKSTGNPSPRLTSYTKRCTTSSNILYTIFIFGDRGHQVIIHPLERENFLVPASPPVLPARRCPCPSPVRGGLCQQAELREEGGEQAIWGGGAST